MKIFLFAAIAVALSQLAMGVISNMNTVSHDRASMSRQSEATDAVVDAAQVIRRAYETHERNGGACPANTMARTLNGRSICWPSGQADACFASQSGSNLCLWFDATVSSASPFSLFPTANAQSYFTARSPASGAPSTGVRMVMPTCGDPSSTPCVDCSNPQTTCFTAVFCVNKGAPCSDRKDQWVQTFAFRRF